MKTTVRLAESAVMLAAAFVLSFIPIVNMPFGGTVTLCSMLPILLIAYRHGVKWGLLTGFAGSLLQLLLGLNNLSYAVSWQAVVAIILLDYVVAFTVLGLGGVFRGRATNQTASLTAGIVLCCLLRFVCHFLSGVTVWRDISIPADQAILYSLSYNAAYMVPETVITVAMGAVLTLSLDIASPRPRAAVKTKGRPWMLVALLVSVVSATVSALVLFSAIQTEEGFSVAAATPAHWMAVGAAATVAAVSAARLSRKA